MAWRDERRAGCVARRGSLMGEFVSPYLQRRLRNLEEMRQHQVSRQVLNAVIVSALSDAKAAGHGPVGQIDRAAQAALKARPELNALDALEAVERIRRRGLF